jgi:hypothetical protein
VRAIPPIPGITADIDVYHQVAATGTSYTVICFGEPWLSSTGATAYALANIGVPYQVLKHDIGGTIGTSRLTTAIAMAPDLAYVPDSTLDNTAVFGSTSGSVLRYGLFHLQMNTMAMPALPQHLGWDVRGFKIAR